MPNRDPVKSLSLTDSLDQISSLREALREIGTLAHCIAKAGPSTTPDLATAWAKFMRISAMADAALAQTARAHSTPRTPGVVGLSAIQPEALSAHDFVACHDESGSHDVPPGSALQSMGRTLRDNLRWLKNFPLSADRSIRASELRELRADDYGRRVARRLTLISPISRCR